ncbi:hypothetical protein J6590_038807 [Homalodisca vitripennis]|nr:hypothetical protein J6590_038807 [Homalodisca vitripennis]
MDSLDCVLQLYNASKLCNIIHYSLLMYYHPSEFNCFQIKGNEPSFQHSFLKGQVKERPGEMLMLNATLSAGTVLASETEDHNSQSRRPNPNSSLTRPYPSPLVPLNAFKLCDPLWPTSVADNVLIYRERHSILEMFKLGLVPMRRPRSRCPL